MCSETVCVCIHIECGSFSSPEHHNCSEAQYYLLKEITETFPRVKTKTKEEENKLEKYFIWFPSLVYFEVIFIGETGVGKIQI